MVSEEGGGVGGAGGVHDIHAWSQSYDHRSSHSYNAGTKYVGFSPTKQRVGWGRGAGEGYSSLLALDISPLKAHPF